MAEGTLDFPASLVEDADDFVEVAPPKSSARFAHESKDDDANESSSSSSSAADADDDEKVDLTQPLVPPKRPMAGFFLYINEHRAGYKALHPEAGVAIITKALSEQWAGLGEEGQKVGRRLLNTASPHQSPTVPRSPHPSPPSSPISHTRTRRPF